MMDDPVNSGEATTLQDLGERRILREVIPRFTEPTIGDDCATVELASRLMVVTTDPVPRPAAQVIAEDNDPFWLGWLLVTINASDIAASGAEPEGFVAALDLPGKYPLQSFERLLDGIRVSCRANGLRYIGGNIRETGSAIVSAVGTAFGSSRIPPLTRRGASAGDWIVVLGQGGRFWADAFRARAGAAVDKATSPLFSPLSQARVVHHLHSAGLLRCAMDTSDGFAPTLEELAFANEVGVEVDLQALRDASSSGDSAADVGGRPERLWFGWGDWTVVAAVAEPQLAALSTAMTNLGKPWSAVGHVIPGPPRVELVDGANRLRAERLESERFAPDSWFIEGINGYIRRLQGFPLP